MASFKLNYLQIKDQIDHLIKSTDFPLRVQKIYSTEHFIHLETRAPGQSLHVYLGRGSHYEGLFLWDKKPFADSRRQDKYLEYLRKNLRGQKIINVKMIPTIERVKTIWCRA